MPGQIFVNSQTISGASQDVKSTADNIKAQLEDLEAGVRRICQSWEGGAQQAYRDKQTEWDQRAASLHSTLEQIAAALDGAAENYRITEQRNTGLWAHH